MPEKQNIEWKQSWRDEYLQWVSGFANANGGILYIGKDDNGNVVGVDKYKKLMDELPNKIKDTIGIVCDVNLHEENDKYFIEIIVKSMNIPISYKGKFYMRSGSTNQLLTGTALNDFISKSDGKDWEEVILPHATIENIDLDAVESFKKNAVKSGRLPYIGSATAEEVLSNLKLVDKNGNYKRACVLLFGKNPQEFIRSAYLKIGRFGESSSDLQSQEVIEGNAFEIADNVIKILNDKYVIRTISYDDLQRVETPEYPFEAIREALLNAIIHREYENTPIFLSLYSDRVTLMNQGELTDKLKVEDLKTKHLSYPRNELVASVFYKAGLIETWGRGTITILEECEKYGLPEPKIEVYGGAFSITLFKDIYNEEYLSKLNINERQQEVVQYIKENKYITSGQYQTKFDVSKATTRRDIEELLELFIVKSEGTGRATKYVIDVEGYNTRQ